MIIIDEQMHGDDIVDAIALWYRGNVQSITQLRPHTVIKDDAIPSLLLRIKQPTFITINATDFWRRVRAHSNYCIIVFPLPKEDIPTIPSLLRNLMQLTKFDNKAKRMGKVIRVTYTRIVYYGVDQQLHRIKW